METETSIAKRKAQVFWLGPDWPTSLSSRYHFVKASAQEAFAILEQSRFAAAFIQYKEAADIEFIEKIVWLYPHLPITLLVEHLSEETVRVGINQLHIHQFLSWPIEAIALSEAIADAVKKSEVVNERENLLREYTDQNKKLEAMTEDLERNVEERTAIIETSTAEEANKLARERQLIRFINELAVQESFVDVLHSLRKEIRRFHKVQGITFAWHQGEGLTRFYEYRNSRFIASEAKAVFSLEAKSLAEQETEIRQFFANQFGRPLSKSIFFPLQLKLVRQAYGFNAQAIFCFEYSLMSEAELIDFKEFIDDRLQSLGIVLDRVLLEQHLEASTARWEKTFDGLRDPLAILDSEGQVIRANSKFTKDMIQKSNNGEISVGRKFYKVFSYPIRFDSQGQYTNLINHYVDITESREIYLRLLQSEKMGAIGQLAGHIAHELNNPLTGIRSLAQVLMKGLSSESQLYQDLQHVEQSAARSQLIIKYLLDFARGEEQPTESISVDEIVERTLPMVKTIIRQHRHILDLNSREFKVQVEPHLLQQVIFNLVNNACQAMRDPGQISLTTRVVGVKGGQVELKVTDTGPGIPLEIQARIFEPFFTTKKEGHGTGLGLSTGQSIVQKFGGTLSFESDGKTGTSFIIRLPIATEKK